MHCTVGVERRLVVEPLRTSFRFTYVRSRLAVGSICMLLEIQGRLELDRASRAYKRFLELQTQLLVFLLLMLFELCRLDESLDAALQLT